MGDRFRCSRCRSDRLRLPRTMTGGTFAYTKEVGLEDQTASPAREGRHGREQALATRFGIKRSWCTDSDRRCSGGSLNFLNVSVHKLNRERQADCPYCGRDAGGRAGAVGWDCDGNTPSPFSNPLHPRRLVKTYKTTPRDSARCIDEEKMTTECRIFSQRTVIQTVFGNSTRVPDHEVALYGVWLSWVHLGSIDLGI